MSTSRDSSADRPISLAGERLLPHSRRQSWARDLVWFQIDELNGLFDGLQTHGRGQVSTTRLIAARRRSERIVLAATWNEKMYDEQTRAFLGKGLERPEDAFGPAMLLLGTMKTPSQKIQRWLDDLPPTVVRTIELLVGVKNLRHDRRKK